MKKVWIDTDPGIDDTLAIAMLFEADDQIAVMGVSSVFGNAGVEQTTKNLKLILEKADKNDVTIAKGAHQPLVVPLDTSPYVHGDNGMGNMLLPEPEIKETSMRAPQAMIDVVLANPGEITLLLIGPLTNAAIAVILEPAVANAVKEVVIMGGAVYCPGNITPAAEANFFHDPHAAQIVMNAGWKITLAPLDVNNQALVPQALLDKIVHANKKLTPFLAGGLPHYQRFLKSIGMYGQADFPDALAAGYLLAPEIFSIKEIPLYIETEGACMGQSLPVPTEKWYQDLQDTRVFSADQNISPVNVLLDVNQDKFFDLLTTLLT
jgi:inosine-uridine nucleoside N-ribohydrolase